MRRYGVQPTAVDNPDFDRMVRTFLWGVQHGVTAAGGQMHFVQHEGYRNGMVFETNLPKVSSMVRDWLSNYGLELHGLVALKPA